MRTALALRNAAAIGFGIVMAVTSLTGCGSNAGTVNSNEPITLTINLFGDFGYKDLYTQYQTAHPNITIKENVTDYGTHHQNLQAHLLASAGTADIEAIEIGQVAGFQPQAAKFTNFLDYAVDTSVWTEQKWKAAASSDGKIVFGVGTDVGGLAMCYRADLLKAAGMPDDPAAVAALVPTWEAYSSVGQQFLTKTPDPSVKWFDAASNVFSAIVAQSPTGFYDSSGAVVAGTNQAVKAAWDTTVAAIKSGESAQLAAFTPQWNTGFQKGQFATIMCPAWMTSYIRSNAPETAGKWNIARIPGTGGGNWGGSYLAVPKASKNVQAAVDLAKWLTAPEQQTWLFKNKGNFPSAKALWSQPDVANFKDSFFSDAPVGQIFSASQLALKPQPLGAHAGDIGNAFGNALVSIEQGKATADEAWTKALADVKNLTS
jgi:cellobiose transport system substrate-binding protein